MYYYLNCNKYPIMKKIITIGIVYSLCLIYINNHHISEGITIKIDINQNKKTIEHYFYNTSLENNFVCLEKIYYLNKNIKSQFRQKKL